MSELLPVDDDVRFGEAEAATTSAAPAGGGGGNAAAAGAVVQGISMGINAVASGIGMAVDQQNRPDVTAKEQTLRFVGAMNELRRVHEELRRKQEAHRAAVAWLQSPTVKVQWMSGPAALAAAPRGSKVCPPLYQRAEVFGVPAPIPSPGGHAFGDPSCRCPNSDCAYKQSARKHLAAVRADARDSEQQAWAIVHNRRAEGDVKNGIAGNTGNIKQITREAVSAWSLLMALDALSPLFIGTGMMSAWGQGIPDLYTPPTLDLLFGRKSYTALSGEPPDPDAVEGRVPAAVANRALTTGLGLYALGNVPASYTMPLWVYGFTPAEVQQYGSGPTIGQVAAVQAQLWSSPKFGAAPDVAGLRDRLRDLITTGAITQVAPAPPTAADPQAALLAQEAQRGAQLALTTERHRRNVQIGIGLGAFAALVGGAVWYRTRR